MTKDAAMQYPMVATIKQLVIFKVFYWLTLILCVKELVSLKDFNNLVWPDNETASFMSHFAAFDGSFYLRISEMGYVSGDRTSALYPLWPEMIRLGAHFTSGNHLLAGLLLSNCFSVLGWLIFHRLVTMRFGYSIGNFALLFLIVFPGAMFYQLNYSESVFFLLLMCLWWSLEKQHWPVAIGAAFLLSMTRPIGVFCVLPIIAYSMEYNRIFEAKAFNTVGKWCPSVRKQTALDTKIETQCSLTVPKKFVIHFRSPCMIIMLAPIFGWLFYLFLMWKWTGTAFDGFAAQRYWGVHSIHNLVDLPKFINSWFSPRTWQSFDGALMDRFSFTFVVYSIALLWRIDKKLIVWVYFLGILPVMSGMFVCATRYLAVAFPMFVAMGIFFSPRPRRLFGYCLAFCFIVWQCFLCWYYVNFRWAN